MGRDDEPEIERADSLLMVMRLFSLYHDEGISAPWNDYLFSFQVQT